MKKFIFSITLVCCLFYAGGQSISKPELSAVLEKIYDDDQAERLKIDSLQKIHGWQSEQMTTLFKKMQVQDSLNLQKIKEIIGTYGWLGPDEVGKKGSQTLFLVIQHADSLTQVTYLPVMKDAVKKGKAQPQHLALLEDRILTRQGKEQIYGSQVKVNESGKYEFFPILDEPNVNTRRAAVGLGPLEEYGKHFGIDYVLPKRKE